MLCSLCHFSFDKSRRFCFGFGFFFTVFGELKSNCLSHRSVIFMFPALFLGKFCIPDTADIYNLGFAHFGGREGMWLANVNI